MTDLERANKIEEITEKVKKLNREELEKLNAYLSELELQFSKK